MSQPSASGSEGSRYVSETVAGEAATPLTEAQTPELLERVVRETLAISVSDEPLDDADMRRLRQVARRHAGSPLVAEPVAAELVYAILEGHFVAEVARLRDGRSLAEGVWRAAAVRIAQTLLDDPTSKARLERFWTRLVGELR